MSSRDEQHGPEVRPPTAEDFAHLGPAPAGAQPVHPDATAFARARGAAAARLAERAQVAARGLITRTRVMISNGVDLRDPERLADFVVDQVMETIRAAVVSECACGGSEGVAAAALISHLAREVATAEAGR